MKSLIVISYGLSAWQRLQKAFLLAAILVAGTYAGSAQHIAPDSAQLRFRQSKWVFDASFSSNSARLDSIIAPLKRMAVAPERYRIDSVKIIGAASPEGPAAFNHWLSERRAEVLAQRVRHSVALPDSIVSLEGVGRDWRGLLSLAERDEAIPGREELLPVIRGIINRQAGDTPAALTELKRVGGGEPYTYIYTHLFPQLREARLQIAYTAMMPRLPQVGAPQLGLQAPQFPTTELFAWSALRAPAQPKPFYMALKTNLLFDALAVPNISAEFYLGKNWSLGANWMYAWWDKDRTHRYWRIYGGDIALRYWFGSKAHIKPLTGHHVGIYGGILTFDFEKGGTGYMGGLPKGTLWDRNLINAGVEYGYSLPIARRLNLDFTIGVGYITGKYLKYEPGTTPGNYMWKSTHNLRWLGPTKAEVSLVWLIGRGNYNARKGGAR